MKISMSFDIKYTNTAKGIACLLLLFHHLFLSASDITPLIYFKSNPLACELANFGKICVAIFLILSGYGMSVIIQKNKTYSTNILKTSLFVSLRQLWKLWANYIVIFLLFVPWQPLFNHFPYNSWWECLIDISGLAFLFKTTTINETWWYMTIAIFAYILTPIFELIVSKSKISAVALACILYTFFIFFGDIFWIAFYYIGYIIGKTSVFNKLSKYKQNHQISTFISCIIILLSSVAIRYIYPLSSDIFLSLCIIVFSFLFLSNIKVISWFLELLGKHSGNIFMFHTFIYAYDFKTFVYSFKYVPIIYICFILICLAISFIIELIKKYTFTNRFISYVSEKILKIPHTNRQE